MSDYLIQIIDDEPIQREVLENFLMESGYKVASAEDGAQGLMMMKERLPDLILLDIQMPVLDGFQTLEVIRNKSEFRDLPVLFLTSQEEQLQKIRGLELGADDYITKPFNREELLARIKAVLRRTERFRRQEKGLEGDLKNISIFDLLLSMDVGSKTVTISMQEIDGKIFIENGLVVYVRQGPYKDDEALMRIFLREKGAFYVKFDRMPEDIPKKPKPLRAVLIEVLARLELGEAEYIREARNRPKVIERIKEALQRTERYQRAEGVMEGDLSDINLTDLMQNMELSAKTAYIGLEDIDGEIYIKEGKLILVRQGRFNDIPALTRIFLLEKGRFSIRFNELPAKLTDSNRSITSAMINVLTEVDEVRDILNRIKAHKITLKIMPKGSGFPMIDDFIEKSPLPFIELLVLMEGALTANLSVVIKALKKGKLKILKETNVTPIENANGAASV